MRTITVTEADYKDILLGLDEIRPCSEEERDEIKSIRERIVRSASSIPEILSAWQKDKRFEELLLSELPLI